MTRHSIYVYSPQLLLDGSHSSPRSETESACASSSPLPSFLNGLATVLYHTILTRFSTLSALRIQPSSCSLMVSFKYGTCSGLFWQPQWSTKLDDESSLWSPSAVWSSSSPSKLYALLRLRKLKIGVQPTLSLRLYSCSMHPMSKPRCVILVKGTNSYFCLSAWHLLRLSSHTQSRFCHSVSALKASLSSALPFHSRSSSTNMSTL